MDSAKREAQLDSAAMAAHDAAAPWLFRCEREYHRFGGDGVHWRNNPAYRRYVPMVLRHGMGFGFEAGGAFEAALRSGFVRWMPAGEG